jgi:hypothetical protein
MRRRDSRQAALLLAAFAGVTLCLAGAARAQGIGSLYSDLTCPVISDVPGNFKFDTSFVGLPTCAQLCAAAGTACRRDVDDATSCNLAFADDFIAFDSRLDCDGLTGSRLSDCKAGWAADRFVWRSSVRINQFVGRNSCDTQTTICQGKCTGQ